MESKLFKWDSDFITGHKKIDAQHFGLIETINHLMQLSFQPEEPNDQDIETLKWQLTDYTVEHFKTEEELMAKYKVDPRHQEMHIKAHEDFVSKIKEYFKSPLELKNRQKLAEINEFLIRWLAYHILSMDKSLVRQINTIQNDATSPKYAYDHEVKDIETSTEPLLKALKALFFLVSQKNKELEQKVKERTQELENANQKLEKLSMIDELTELPNRRYAMQEIEKLIYDWKRYQMVFSVIFLDLDKFKAVNDDHGHDAGDYVLKWVSGFIQKHIRKSDLLCRLGGDEFIIVVPHSTGSETLHMANLLLEIVQGLAPNEHPYQWKPSFSMGIIEVNERVDTGSVLLTKADAAMYESKRAGGSTVTLQQIKEC